MRSLADVPVGYWVLMTNSAGETYFVQRVGDTAWHIDGDVTLHIDDLVDVQEWQVLNGDPYDEEPSHWGCGPAIQVSEDLGNW